MDYVLIGKIATTFALKGEVKLDVYTDFAEDRFKKDSTVYLKKGNGEYIACKIKNKRYHQRRLLLSFYGYEDINLIEPYKGAEVFKAKDDIPPLLDGEYYFNDLKGLKIYADQELKGEVITVEEGPKYNFLRVKTLDCKEILIPFIPVFVKNVDLKSNRIDINVIEGLL